MWDIIILAIWLLPLRLMLPTVHPAPCVYTKIRPSTSWTDVKPTVLRLIPEFVRREGGFT